jgi:hypothetical protein
VNPRKKDAKAYKPRRKNTEVSEESEDDVDVVELDKPVGGEIGGLERATHDRCRDPPVFSTF